MTAPLPTSAVHDAIAVVTCWLDDDRALATPLAAAAADRDPLAFLEALGGLVTVLGDVCAQDEIDLPAIVRDVAMGVAQAEAEHPAGTDRLSGPPEDPDPPADPRRGD